jgi:hypothetical protein
MSSLEWLTSNVRIVSSKKSLVMVFVWLFDANLFFRDVRTEKGTTHARPGSVETKQVGSRRQRRSVLAWR